MRKYNMNDMNIVERLNKAILVMVSSGILGSVFFATATVFALAAGMGPGTIGGAGIIVGTLFVMSLIAALILFFSPVWYFFFRRGIRESDYAVLAVFTSLFVLNIVVVVIAGAVHEPQYRGDEPAFLEIIPLFLMFMVPSIFAARMLFFVLDVTRQRSENTYFLIQLVWIVSLALNIIYTAASIPNQDELASPIRTFFTVFSLLVFLSVPLLAVVFISLMYKNVSYKRLINGVESETEERSPAAGVDLNGVFAFDRISLKQKLNRSIILMGIVPIATVTLIYFVESYLLLASGFIVSLFIPLWYTLRWKLRSKKIRIAAFVFISLILPYIIVKAFDVLSEHGEGVSEDFMFAYVPLFMSVYIVLLLARVLLGASDMISKESI